MSGLGQYPFYSVQRCLHAGNSMVLWQVITPQNTVALLKAPSLNQELRLKNTELQYEKRLLDHYACSALFSPEHLNTHPDNPSLLYQTLDANGAALCSLEEAWRLPLAVSQQFQLAIGLVEALQQLHQQQLVLANMEPSLLLVDDPQAPKQLYFADINSAVPMAQIQDRCSQNLRRGTGYFSPEETARTNHIPDHRSDLYNLGLLLFRLFSGQFPFPSQPLSQLIYAHIAEAPRMTLFPSQYPSLKRLVAQLLEKNPENRPVNLAQILDVLRANQNGLPSPSRETNNTCANSLYMGSHLYGRETAKQHILEGLSGARDGQPTVIAIAGPSGIGKSALVQQLQPNLNPHRCQLLSGKYEQLNKNQPLAGFIQAVAAFISTQKRTPETVVTQWLSKVRSTLGANIRVICDVLPELAELLEDIPNVPTLPDAEQRNRFVTAFRDFIQLCHNQEGQTLLFLDDMQWADSASFWLLKQLWNDPTLSHIVVILAYRDNEVDTTHPVIQTLERLPEHITPIHLHLAPLTRQDTQALMQATFTPSRISITPLADWVHSQTLGNPFFTRQLLKTLEQHQQLQFDPRTGLWSWHFPAIEASTQTHGVLELLGRGIAELSSEAQHLLPIAAAFGSHFDLARLSIVMDHSPTTLKLSCKECEQSGLIRACGGNATAVVASATTKEVSTDTKTASCRVETESCSAEQHFQFVHDRIQQAAYQQLSPHAAQALHLKIGQALYRHYQQDESQWFDICSHINKGAALLCDTEKLTFAKLNLQCAQNAKSSGDYALAEQLLSTGIAMLPTNAWQDHYSLTYAMELALLQCQYLSTRFQAAQATSHRLLQEVADLNQQVPIYIAQILNAIAHNQMADAVSQALTLVEQLGFELESQPPDGVAPIQGPAFAITAAEIQALAALPDMQDENAKSALKVLAIAGSPAYLSDPEAFEKICYTMLSLCARYGNSADSAYSYAVFGLICAGFEHFQSGYQYCQLGLSMLKRYQHAALKPQILEIFNVHVKHWCDPLKDALPGMQAGVTAGKQTGGIEFASYNAAFYCSYILFSGSPIPKVLQESQSYWQLLQSFNQGFCLSYAGIWISTAKMLQGECELSFPCRTPYFDSETDIPRFNAGNNLTALYSVYQSQALCCAFMGDYSQGYRAAIKAQTYAGGVYGMRNIVENHFYLGVCCALNPELAQQQRCREMGEIIKRFQQWQASSKAMCSPKLRLLQALQCLLEQDLRGGLLALSEASHQAVETGFLQDHALAALLLFQHHCELGVESICITTFKDAIQALSLWQADGVILHWLKRYPQFAPHCQYQVEEGALVKTHSENAGLLQQEINTLLETLVSISEEMDEQQLYRKLLWAAANLLGANRAQIIDTSSTTPEVVAHFPASISSCQDADAKIQMQGASAPPNYCQTAVAQCLQTRMPYLCDNALADPELAQDPYIQTQAIRSLLYVPLTGTGAPLAVLSLENTLGAHMFTQENIYRLSAIARQSAIVLENARLYHDLEQENEQRKIVEQNLEQLNHELEDRINERTQALQQSNRELQHSLSQLKSTQSKLVESEKMASLGSLVAGVAHEVNTPIGAGLSAATHLQETFQGVQQHYQQGSLTESTFEHLLSTADSSITMVVSNLDRAANLIRSFKRVSVDQSDEKITQFELLEYIQDVVTSLQPNYKHMALEFRFTGLQHIVVQQVAGALAQVLTNLILNAVQHGFCERPQGVIHIDIAEDKQQITLTFTDNGTGMDAEQCQKIFDPFYTTRRHQGGSGLGMHIAYNLMTQTLHGSIAVTSQSGDGTQFALNFPQQLQQ